MMREKICASTPSVLEAADLVEFGFAVLKEVQSRCQTMIVRTRYDTNIKVMIYKVGGAP